MTLFFLRILIVIIVLWLLRRLIASLTGPPANAARKKSGEAPRPANNTVKDPVCGMYMDPRLAVRVDQGKGSFYFCSDECKNKFFSNSRQ